MRIELHLNSVVVDKQELDSIVGSFLDSSGYSIAPHRKPTKRRRRTKCRTSVATVIDTLIDQITEG